MTLRQPLQSLSLNIPVKTHAAGSSLHSLQDVHHQTNDTAFAFTHNAGKGSSARLAFASPILPELLPQVFLWVVIACAGQTVVDREKNFLLSGAEGYGHGHFSGGSSLRALLDLGQVCRSWREVVYATPLLWSHIHFSKLESKEGDAARHQESMNFMLTRSKRHSLSVTVSLGAHNHVYDGYYGEEHVSPFMEILSTLVSQQWRLKHLTMDMHICSPIAMLPQRLTDMPELKTLVLRSPVDDGADEAIIEINLNRSPLLTHLHLDGDFLLKPVTRTLPNLKIVRMLYRETFRKDFPSVEDCMSLLQFAPTLEVLQVDISSNIIPEEKVEICSSTLRVFSLRVNDETDEAARYLLDSVTFPNMEALELDIGRSTTADEGPHEHIYGFLRRCKAPLTSFAFCSEETDEHDLMRYLRLMPSLQDLKLTDIIKLTEEGVRALTLRGNRTDNLCPKLESLSFYDRTLEDDPLGSSDFLTVMLMSRWLGASGALKKFRLCGCGWRGFAKLPLIQMCVEDGLEVLCK